MKVTGHRIKEALRVWGLRKEAIAKQFSSSLHTFGDGDNRLTPFSITEKFMECEEAIAKLQVAQAEYNLKVSVRANLNGVPTIMSLCEAVKRAGGAGRVESMWRGATVEESNRYGVTLVRDPNQIHAKRTVSIDEAIEQTMKHGATAGSLKAAIAEGNTKEMDLEVDPKILV